MEAKYRFSCVGSSGPAHPHPTRTRTSHPLTTKSVSVLLLEIPLTVSPGAWLLRSFDDLNGLLLMFAFPGALVIAFHM